MCIRDRKYSVNSNGNLEIEWSEGEHKSYYDPSWLRENCYTLKNKKKYVSPYQMWDSSLTNNLKSITRNADIIISALGIPEFLKSDMVKKGVVIIDVGITRVHSETSPKGYIIKGDVDYKNVSEKSSAITPVPGGVGPMTISMLLKNTFLACQRKD